jgi:hypothetical protein
MKRELAIWGSIFVSAFALAFGAAGLALKLKQGAYLVPVIEAPPRHRVGSTARPARVIAGVPAYFVRLDDAPALRGSR